MWDISNSSPLLHHSNCKWARAEAGSRVWHTPQDMLFCHRFVSFYLSTGANEKYKNRKKNVVVKDWRHRVFLLFKKYICTENNRPYRVVKYKWNILRVIYIVQGSHQSKIKDQRIAYLSGVARMRGSDCWSEWTWAVADSWEARAEESSEADWRTRKRAEHNLLFQWKSTLDTGTGLKLWLECELLGYLS